MPDYIADWMKRSPAKKKPAAAPEYGFEAPTQVARPGAVTDNFMKDAPLTAGVTTPEPQRGIFVGGEPWRAAIPDSIEEAGAAGQRAADGRRAIENWNAENGGAPGPEWDRKMAGLERASKLASPDPVGDYRDFQKRTVDSAVAMGIRPPEDMDPREAFLRKQSQNGAVAPMHREAAQRELDERRSAASAEQHASAREREAEALAINDGWKQDNYGNLTNVVTKEVIRGQSQPVKLGLNEVLFDPATQKLIADNMEVVTKGGVKVKDVAAMMKDSLFMPPEQKAKYFAAFNSVMDELKGGTTSAGATTHAPTTKPEVKPKAEATKKKSRIWNPDEA